MHHHRPTLASIIPHLPLEAVHWLENLDALGFTAAEIVLDSVGPDDFVEYWEDGQRTVALDYTEPWPLNAIRAATR